MSGAPSFRGDGDLQNALLPIIRPLLADKRRSDRRYMVYYLGENASTSEAAREILETLARSPDEPELAEAAREALESLTNTPDR